MTRTLAAVIGSFLILLASGISAADNGATPAVKNDAVKPEDSKKVAPLAVGQSLPAFETTDDAGLPWKSADHVGKKILVLYFYPGDFTGGCTRQAQAYRDALARIEQLGAEVVGVSGDDVTSHKLFKETFNLPHTLLSDSQGALASLLDLPVKAGSKVKAMGPDRKPLLDDKGNRIEIIRALTLPRWTLVVDRAGKIISLRSVTNPVTDAEEVEKLVAANQPMARIGAQPREMAITCFALAADGDTLALGGNDGTIRLWSLTASNITRVIDTKAKGYTGSVAFSPDGKQLAFHTDDDPVRVWDLDSGRESARLPQEFLAVEQLCFAPSGRQVGIVSDSEGFVWNLDSGKVWKSEQPVTTLAFSPDGTTLALGFNTLRLAKAATGASIREIGKMDGRVATLQFSPAGDQILVVDSACPGTSVRLLESETGEELILGEKIRMDRAAASFSKDGRTIVTSNEFAQLAFWDPRTGEKRQTLSGLDRSTNATVFSPDGKLLLTGQSGSIADVVVWKVPVNASKSKSE
jgi:peroxiredoxin Q/BCP